MSEYEIYWKLRGFIGQCGIDIVEANSAQEAVEKHRQFNISYEDEYDITDIEKIGS